MPLFARVFVTVLDSSIAEDFTLRHVFEDLFKLCDWRTGVVDMTRQAIARRLNIPLKIVSECIDRLESPDPASRDPAHQGRRLERLDEHRDWGWRILNWQKYDAIRNRADAVVRVQRHREKKKDEGGVTGPPGPRSTPRDIGNRPGSVEEVIEAGKMLSMNEAACRKFWLHYEGTSAVDPSGNKIWVTGQTGEKRVGSWRSVLGSWKATDEERLAVSKGQGATPPIYRGQRSPKEAHREAGKPVEPLPVETFSNPAQKQIP